MNVYKFGGASLNSIDRIKNTAEIIKNNAGNKTLIVISAMGKTTNALEKVVESYFDNRKEDALKLFEQIKESHINTLKYLVTLQWNEAMQHMTDFFTEVEWMLHDKPVRSFDYYYDQIVCCGELLSSNILSAYLKENKINNTWLDVRDIIKTDNNFRDAGILWKETSENVDQSIQKLFETINVVITQGFIGSTDENESTTLGREGSDYTAAVFANLLHAESVTIWKDVEAVMSADPKQFSDAVNIPSLSYREVIEMAFYGAQVIHPKTIKPLYNKNIPLLVKSFLDPSLPGTVINNNTPKQMPPVIVLKQKQVLISFQSRDFSFVEEELAEQSQQWFHALKIKSNLSQHTAISLLCCLDDHAEKIDQLAAMASENFDVMIEKNLSLLTIRHYPETFDQYTEGKTILLEQKTEETVQMVLRGN